MFVVCHFLAVAVVSSAGISRTFFVRVMHLHLPHWRGGGPLILCYQVKHIVSPCVRIDVDRSQLTGQGVRRVQLPATIVPSDCFTGYRYGH